MAKHTLKCVLIFLVVSEFVILDIYGQDGEANLSGDNNQNQNINTKELQVNYQQLRDQPHHIVKRKSKLGGRGFGFGKKTKSNTKPNQQNRDPYPKQPAYNPNYNPGHAPGAPPAYPGMSNNRPGGYPQGPPPAYPGTGGHNNYPAYPPAYPGGSGGYGQPNYGGGGYGTGFNNKGYGGNSGFGGKMGGGGGLGRTLGSAGFGAVAGTALGAYGGYKLGKMVGSLGRNGHYGYYDDNGRYLRCDPPKEIKVDPETNITYIPLSSDYDKRCNYFERRPPSYWGGYTNGAGNSMFSDSHPINRLVNAIINFTIVDNFHLVWDNVFALGIIALLIY